MARLKKEATLTTKFKDFRIHEEVHGTAEPALVFLHRTGVELHAPGRKVTAELEGQFKTVAL